MHFIMKSVCVVLFIGSTVAVIGVPKSLLIDHLRNVFLGRSDPSGESNASTSDQTGDRSPVPDNNGRSLSESPQCRADDPALKPFWDSDRSDLFAYRKEAQDTMDHFLNNDSGFIPSDYIKFLKSVDLYGDLDAQIEAPEVKCEVEKKISAGGQIVQEKMELLTLAKPN